MNPLQDLKDIRIPTAIDSWPPAYGWWLLAAFILFSMILLTLWLIKFRKIRLAKRQALQTLQQIDGTNLDSESQLNQLLKRVAMTYFPQQNVQEMYGVKWTDFLVKTLPNKKAKDVSESFKSMQQSLYQAHNAENVAFPSYRKSVETWIKHALPPSKSVMQKLEQNDA